MALLDLPYLWPATGRGGRLYWFYRRNGLRLPITGLDGERLFPEDAGFIEAYRRIHASFAAEASKVGPKVVIGTLGHAIPLFLIDPETKLNLKPTTQRGYRQYLNELLVPHREGEESHGHRSLAHFSPEAVRKLRNDRKDNPWTANGRLGAISAFLSWVEGRPLQFRLPVGWRNPALSVKSFKTGDGYRPWEEGEIRAYYERWPLGTLERVLGDTFAYTGQRHVDVAKMMRIHYHNGELSVAQEKGGERVPIPAAKKYKLSLEPWLASHPHKPFFPDETGKRLSYDKIGEIMRLAIEAAELPDDCKPHGLRYTAATRLKELGLDRDIIASITGHRTLAMVDKYTKKRRRTQLAIRKLDEALDDFSPDLVPMEID